MSRVHSKPEDGLSIPGGYEAECAANLARELKEERQLHPCNRRRFLRRRLKKACNFPTNTCPASRHVAIMADSLSTDGYYHMMQDEPLHCATGLYAVVAALWEARTRIAELEATAASSVGISRSEMNQK